jgi:hypothetical protein
VSLSTNQSVSVTTQSVALSGDAVVAVTPHDTTAIRVWALDWEYSYDPGPPSGK